MVGLIEGVSTLLLFFIAIPLKYFAGYPMAVTVVGSIHGGLFVLIALMFILAIFRVLISVGLAFGGVFAAIVPFGPFVIDRWLVQLSKRA